MNRPTSKQENRMDENYRRKSGSLHRMVIRLTRRHINRVVKYVLDRAYERGQINSHTLHEMCGCCDRVLWPENYREERANVIQSGNVCGGDMAGGDIYKR